MPWRTHRSPYRVFVSEIMLQQTTVTTVTPRYGAFLKKFPSFRRLAESSVQEVIAAWKGLGYNRRALALRESARIITGTHQGRLPRSFDELVALPGVGRATAAAVIVYAFNIPQAFIEANIRRVFLHFFFPGRIRVSDDAILPLVEQAMDRENPRDWFYALMDYGAFLAAGRAGSLGARASQRSSRYRRQAAFEGSLRQLRGRVLAVLIERRQAARAQMEKELGGDERLGEALDQLVKEGFLKLEKGRYSFK
jgi:A/G-specific adenine glycosylase